MSRYNRKKFNKKKKKKYFKPDNTEKTYAKENPKISEANHSSVNIQVDEIEKGKEILNHLAEETICPICDMPIRNHYIAIRHDGSDKLAHFDCILKELRKKYHSKLTNNFKIYYIGAGNFGIVREYFDRRGNLKSYRIIEKIEYENKSE